MISREPSTADWMLPPEQEPGEFERRWNVAPDRRMPVAEAYKLGGLAAMDDYGEADAPAVYGAYDKAKREEERRAKILSTPMPGMTRDLPPMIERTPESLARDRAMMEGVRDFTIPQTPLDVGLMVAGGPVGGKLARGGAAALGALFEPDTAEAGVLSKAGRVLGGKPGGPHPGGIHVYHSSPHDFDRFDWSKLRTGEGANMYGSGFYFAENPAVSGQGGEYWKQFAPRFEGPEGSAANQLQMWGFDRDKAALEVQRKIDDIETLRKSGMLHPGVKGNYTDPHIIESINKSMLQNLQEEHDLLTRAGRPVGPRTYEVNINARPELMLDWDKPWQAQPKLVQEVARASGIHPESPGPMGTRVMSDSPMGEVAGRNLKDPNSLMIRNMQEAGIPGIRYLDQGSRFSQALYNDNPIANEARKFIKQAGGDTEKAGKLFYESNPVTNWATPERDEIRRLIQLGGNSPSYNYVVTDPSKLDILAKYGVVGTAGGGLGALAARDRYQQ